MTKRRRQTLFARLIMYQAIVGATVAMVFALLIVAERNAVLAAPYGRLLGPQIAAMLPAPSAPARPASLPERGMPGAELRRATATPAGLGASLVEMPGVAALGRELATRGIHVVDARLGLHADPAILWLRVAAQGEPALWVGLPVPDGIWSWTRRMTVGAAIVVAVFIAASWGFARRLARPLEQLKQAMEGHGTDRPGAAFRLSGDATSEIADMQAAFSTLMRRLERQERERSLLLAGVSHDLRAPLTRLRLAAEMLPEATDPSEAVAVITRSVEQADRLVGSFVDFVRAGQLPLDERVSLADLVTGCVRAWSLPHERLSVECLARPALEGTNALLLERLVFNLVDNALKHGRPPVRVCVWAEDDFACIEVRDEGHGIPPEQLDGLLDAFARGEASRGTPGMGLGLAVVREIAQRAGGTVNATRGRDAFSICVRIPLASSRNT